MSYHPAVMKHGTLPQRIARAIQGRALVRRPEVNRFGGYDQVGRAMSRLEVQNRLERLAPGLWRVLRETPAPRLSYSRTWSNPQGVPADTLIAATLADPTYGDLVELCLHYGIRRVRGILEDMAASKEITDPLAERNRHSLQNIARGFARAAKGIHVASRPASPEH